MLRHKSLFILTVSCLVASCNETVLDKILPENTIKTNEKTCQLYSYDEVYDYYNSMRLKVGMIPLDENISLENTAKNHSNYLKINDTTGHTEEPSKKGFTGINIGDRAIYTGYYTKYGLGEGIAYLDTPVKSIDNLMTAIYHRFGILDFKKDIVGIGFSEEKNNCIHNLTHNPGNSILNNLCSIDTYISGKYYNNVCSTTDRKISYDAYQNSFLETASRNPRYVLWPANGEENFITVFWGESPQPIPDYEVTGNPISIQFNEFFYKGNIELVSFKLFESKDNSEITFTRLLDKYSDPNQKFSDHQFALFPIETLKEYTAYRADVIFKHEDIQESVTWYFKTGKE